MKFWTAQKGFEILFRQAFVLWIILFLSLTAGAAAPPNDNCANAKVIGISENGYGLGKFIAANENIGEATVQGGESFAPAIMVAGQTQKSIWYKFSIPTNRSVRVVLTQPGTEIAAGDVGFAVYKATKCLPGNADISTKLTPIALFGNTFHPCVEPGEYLVQVSGKSAVKGLLGVQLEISDTTGALYDRPKEPSEYGKLSMPVAHVDFSVECQSIENATEVCNTLSDYQQYTKTTWHTFTTPDYFDYISILLAAANNASFFPEGTKIGYRLYEGNVKVTPWASLTASGNCDYFMPRGYSPESGGYYADKKIYRCTQLKPKTTYSIQLFYHKDFNKDLRLSIAVNGKEPTKGPEPTITKIMNSNKLGTLPTSAHGEMTSVSDYLACNSQHKDHPCSPALPAAGVRFNGMNYNLSTFYTFTLAGTAKIDLTATGNCGYSYLIRLFKQDVTNNCNAFDTSKMLGQSQYTATYTCLDPGTYTIQLLGSDTMQAYTNFYYGSIQTSSQPLCLLTQLGTKADLYIRATSVRAVNRYSLNTAGAYDAINLSGGIMQPLKPGITYAASKDTFGCQNTVLPEGELCHANINKAMYRQFVVADSGYMSFAGWNGYYNWNKVYKGDANALAKQQNAHKHTDRIKGLVPYSECLRFGCQASNVCLVPGTYTYVSFASDQYGNVHDQPTFTLNTTATRHFNGATAQDMGSILDTVAKRGTSVLYSDVDLFSCKDNAVVINGYKPCYDATKAIYRQFYLKEAATVSIFNYVPYGSCDYTGYLTLFSGKATDGLQGLTALGGRWNCFTQSNPNGSCDILPAGWYTVVSYTTGHNYTNTTSNLNGHYAYEGYKNQLQLTVAQACEGPAYNKPFKAAVDSTTKKPFLLQWGPRNGHTAAYPKTDTTYRLYTENFNCTIDAPFAYVEACSPNVNRVAYYVFQTTQESYINISTQGYWGAVYAADIRKDSLKIKGTVPLQTCSKSNGKIQICKLQPGTYTLVIFVENNASCVSVTPTIYIDQVGMSRFDHAAKAYDFGVIPADSFYHKGKVGDVNPLQKDRAPSNDFFYCTTGAQKGDPAEPMCLAEYLPQIYNTGVNNVLFNDPKAQLDYSSIPRRNLWYTFVIDQPGWVRIKVDNKTIGKHHQYNFAVYKSNVDGTLPFNEVVSKGQVDSTYAQGLTFVNHNRVGYYYYCYGTNEITFYRDPCTATTERFYLLVENRNPYGYGDVNDMNPNSQVEVSVLLDSTRAVLPKFDHYYSAGDMGTVGVGKHKGETDNYSCATRDASDPLLHYPQCKKTLWYKFTSTVTGNIRYRIHVKGTTKFSIYEVQLFKQIIPGDSTSKGLLFQNPAQIYDPVTQGYWAQTCIAAATYYLVLTGCDQVNENVYPEIEIIEQAGDYCSAPVMARLTGAGAKEAKVSIDCHTIGTDYGEYGPTLTCPAGIATATYKSSWFRVDIGGKDTLDVTAYIEENTNAASSQIKYRMMTGDCNAMQEQSCVEDALTQNTYECLVPGRSYYIQVFTPVVVGWQAVTGDITLKLSAKKHAGECAPPPPCLVNAGFDIKFDCNKDSAVRFVNYSTYGASIKYLWDFGYNKQTSTEVSPAFFYPALNVDKSYKVRLVVENTSCNLKDSFDMTVRVPARPYVNLGPDVNLCTVGSSLQLKATSHTGATYYWQNGSTEPEMTANYQGYNQYSVKVSYKECSSTDTVHVFINPITKNAVTYALLCNESVQLTSYRGRGERYLWSTGEEQYYIQVKQPGTYWVDLSLYSCTVRDSFVVATIEDAHPLGADTALCLPENGYKLNATMSGASSYRWQDNTSGAEYTIRQPGLYWVDVTLGNCTIRDSITITAATPPEAAITGVLNICAGDSTLLAANAGQVDYLWSTGERSQSIFAKKGGNYKVTITSGNGCTATATVLVTENKSASVAIAGNKPLCGTEPVHLKVNSGFASYLWSNGEREESITVRNEGKYGVLVTDAKGCTAADSVTVMKSPPPAQITLAATLCAGETYTLPSGKGVSATGLYSDTLRNRSGCDSVVAAVRLTVMANPVNTIAATICAGQRYTLPSGRFVTASGEYAEVLRTTAGCDSTVIVQLTVREKVHVTVDTTICAGQAYPLPSGHNARVSGVYNDTLRTTGGCDSIVTTRLQVREAFTSALEVAICKGQGYRLPGGRSVTTAGTYRDTLQTRTGCDSIIITTLLVKEALAKEVAVSICSGQRYLLPRGVYVSEAGIYRDTLQTEGGCDSIVITRLQVGATITTTVQAAICAGASYTLPSGRGVSAAGSYRDTLQAHSGCDSIITTHLQINTANTKEITAAICSGQSYNLPSGRQVYQEGMYHDTLRFRGGCDSLITQVNLRVGTVVEKSVAANLCYGQRYTLPSGLVVVTAGTYKDTVRSRGGCDSLITQLDLTVGDSAATKVQAAICSGQTYILPSGRQVNLSGLYRDTLMGASGCDSIVNTQLVVSDRLQTAVAAAICPGQAYLLPSGKKVNTAGVYRDTLSTGGGCDSVITTTLVLQEALVREVHAGVCLGQPYTLPDGQQVNRPGTYRDTLTSSVGCDSIVVTILSAGAAMHAVVETSICPGGTYVLPGGKAVREAGTYRDTLSAVSGCDSVVTTHLVLADAIRTAATAVICSGQTYTLPSGASVGQAGVYIDTLSAVSGCDSIITTTLSLNGGIVTTVSASACPGQPYRLPSGQLAEEPDTYRDTIRRVGQCDSIIITELQAGGFVIAEMSATICPGKSYQLPSGIGVREPGIYLDTLQTSNGCDSIVITRLALRPALVREVRAAACAGSGYRLPSGSVVFESGTYRDTLLSTGGCDSVILTNLVVASATTTTVHAAICSGSGYKLPAGGLVQDAGTYTDTLLSVSGCDSIVVTHLRVNLQKSRMATVSICAGQSHLLPSGLRVNRTGIYRDTLQTSNGCDSIVITDLTVKSLSVQEVRAAICEGQAYRFPSGKSVTGTGNFSDTLRGVAGCDSVITRVSLTTNVTTFLNVQASICDGQSYVLPSGIRVERAGVYKDTLKSSLGCDSLISTITLTVSSRPLFGIRPAAAALCEGDSVQLMAYGGDRYHWYPGGSAPDAAATWVTPEVTTQYQAVIEHAACAMRDTVAVTVKVHPRPQVAVTKSNDINCIVGVARLKATGGVTYNWSPAASLDKSTIPNPVATPSETTIYSVLVTSAQGCTTSQTITVAVEKGEAKFEVPNAYTPNGDGLNDCFGVKSWGHVTNLKFSVFDRWGKQVFQTSDPAQCWDGTLKGQPLGTAVFIYVISATTSCGDVQRKGTVTLIR